ncbi:MAG: HAD-IIIA family hydrolase [Leptolyngbyaceae cyanobacterium SM1_1_3]|nr:HAD-IIIA family hydrolase [Leptolyngbyaceae cyanobacterium SM1_1_3]NJM85402.1 HAD-IIIA family hydrolase [Leptolyngbyaceae cyanobacterium RM2_2_21]NJN02527.1 HAD-IIIA family hydrolase [Leptolyngbyaceae cyanobacterium RM1_1_2]NJO08546.1 HAD-IIIA family hydrolase [Leptolyngbyaceae cyanobacterium SL_1_1]
MQLVGTCQLEEAELCDRLSHVRLLALDVDGVLTDGGLYYTDSGEEQKKFNVKDGQGLQLVSQAGFEVAIISASASTATLHRAKKLGIDHVYIGVSPKLPVLEQLCQKLGIGLEQVAYAGDDVKDLSVMQAVGCPLTVADAMPVNQAAAIYITQKGGGQAAVREICELLLAVSKPL